MCYSIAQLMKMTICFSSNPTHPYRPQFLWRRTERIIDVMPCNWEVKVMSIPIFPSLKVSGRVNRDQRQHSSTFYWIHNTNPINPQSFRRPQWKPLQVNWAFSLNNCITIIIIINNFILARNMNAKDNKKSQISIRIDVWLGHDKIARVF